MAADELTGRRVWLKAFWGFDPGNEAYVGFTRESDRKRLLDMYAEGDLVLIYGADTPETAPQQRKQVLGFLEIEPRPIADTDAISDVGLERKKRLGTLDRWTYAVPVSRAWAIQRRIDVKNLVPDTYNPDYARVIASRGELLTSEEARRVLDLPVLPIAVFDRPAPEAWPKEETLRSKLAPSKGIDPTFGTTLVTRQDGEHFLYMMIAEGDVAAVLGWKADDFHGKSLVKVGYSSDPKRREWELNSGLPPAGVFRWRRDVQSRPYGGGQKAKDAEDWLKADMDVRFESLGGEFFVGRIEDMRARFYSAPGVGFVIRGR